MMESRQPALSWLTMMDPASRQRVVWFVCRLLALAILTFGPCLTSARSFGEAAAFLSLACALAAIVSAIFARLCRDPFAQGSLNGWDEALALVAASRLAHLAMEMQA